MYTHESGKRATDPNGRAHDHLAAGAVQASSPEEVAAAVRVLNAMADQALLKPLLAEMTTDISGNPIMDTPDQRLAQCTWSDAQQLTDRLQHITSALSHAATAARAGGE